MLKILLILTGLLCFTLSEAVSQTANIQASQTDSTLSLVERLKQIPDFEITELKISKGPFTEGYKIMVTQPIDHNDPKKGTFKQKMYLSHLDFSKPVVIELDGYHTPDAKRTHELAKLLDANYVLVEHRYFGESVPDSIIWNCLSIKQSADDHHRIIQLLKKIYNGKWISTGISKGGQTTIYHRKYYPDDVDVSVPYVAPLNKSVHDERIYHFLDNIGTEECRKKLRDFQRAVLSNRKKIFPMFVELQKTKGYEFNHDIERIFELSVLEFEFAYWQWDGRCSNFPDPKSKAKEIFDFFRKYDAESFFEKTMVKKTFPFLYQAYTEVGLYGYRIDYYKDLLEVIKEDVDNYETFIPKEFNIKYDPSTLREILAWLDEHGNNIIYIYGEKDAWSSTAYTPTNKTNALSITKKDGNHSTRINNLPQDQQDAVYKLLEEWLNIKINK